MRALSIRFLAAAALLVGAHSSGHAQGVVPSIPTRGLGVTRTRTVCTLPAYTAGGNTVCTDAAGVQTTTACAANTACQVLPANTSRRSFTAMNRSPSTTCELGYTATVAPGQGLGMDGPNTAPGAQGGAVEEVPAHTGTYFVACTGPATLVFVQGQ